MGGEVPKTAQHDHFMCSSTRYEKIDSAYRGSSSEHVFDEKDGCCNAHTHERSTAAQREKSTIPGRPKALRILGTQVQDNHYTSVEVEDEHAGLR